VHGLAAKGERVAAYGAAAKGATLLNFAGIDGDVIGYVVDRNPHKVGRYMPGLRIGDLRAVRIEGARGSAQIVQLLHGALHRFTSATMDAISSPPPHSISLGGLRTPAPSPWRRRHGRHPKTFTRMEIASYSIISSAANRREYKKRGSLIAR
jgi:hypothetical protein